MPVVFEEGTIAIDTTGSGGMDLAVQWDQIVPALDIPLDTSGGTSGFGGTWGDGWGTSSGVSATLQLLSAIPIAENVLRLSFNESPSYTGLLDATDASRRQRYTIVPDTSTYGSDGLPSRPVSVIAVQLALKDDPGGRLIDIVVDRPFSPDPAMYTVTVNGLISSDTGDVLDPSFVSAQFYGVTRIVTPPDPSTALTSKDFSNPQTVGMLMDATGENAVENLGTHPVDNTGDYAIDSGIQSLKKRVFRRLISAKGSFLHATDYGVGIPLSANKLNVTSVREGLAAEAEAQIAQEPDVRKVRVQVASDSTDPSVVRFYIYVRTTAGIAVKFEAPFAVS